MNQNLEFKNILDEIDSFEKNFQTNFDDESLIIHLQKIFDTTKEKKLNTEELTEIQSRLILFRKLFDSKKQELKEQSSNLLRKESQLKTYLANSDIKNNK